MAMSAVTLAFFVVYGAISVLADSPRLCDPGQQYCGKELAKMGYTNVEADVLYECNEESNAYFYHRCPYFGCRTTTYGSHCPFKNNTKYCGYERKLMNDRRPFIDHALYNAQGNLIKSCSGRCVSKNFTGDASCAEDVTATCTTGQNYCGLQLTWHKFKTFSPQHLLKCNNGQLDADSVTTVERCQSGCIIDTPARCNTSEPPQKPVIPTPDSSAAGPPPAGGDSTSGTGDGDGDSQGGGEEENENCPFACPPGWTRFGYSENCYRLPAQPAKLDTFWNHQQRCKALEKTSHIIVINSVWEQAVATPVAFQYALNWFGVLLNGFMWIGGYTSEGGWKFLDGSEQSSNILMVGANLIGSRAPNTCIGADPKTLGLWQTYPCTVNTGAAICEMPKRRVCGRTGGMLPISPISMRPSQWANLFPKMPSIPYVGQILGESAIGNALTGAGNWLTKTLGGSTDPSECPLACPPGWIGAGFVSESCYLMPKMPAKLDTFWNTEAWCKSTDPTAYISIANGFMEQAIASGIMAYYAPNWVAVGTNAHIWLGAYTTNHGWRFLDGTDQTSNPLMVLANLLGPTKNGTCLSADAKTAGLWITKPCSDTTGTGFCEMPKKPICGGETGTVFPFPIVELTPESLKNLFPKAPSIPFLGQILGGGGVAGVFNPTAAQQNNASGSELGDATTYVICAKRREGLTSVVTQQPVYVWLLADNKAFFSGNFEIPGKWTQHRCGHGVVHAFKVQPATYLAVWSRCRSQGYDTAQPAKYVFSSWYPFQVETNLTEHFGVQRGLLSNSYPKRPMSTVQNC